MEEKLFDILVQYSGDPDCVKSLESLSTIHLKDNREKNDSQIQQEFLELKNRYPITETSHERNLDLYEEATKVMTTLEDQEKFYKLVDNDPVICPFLTFLLMKKANDIKDGKWPIVDFHMKRVKTYSIYK